MTDFDPLARRIARKFLSQQEEDGEVVSVAPPGWEGPIKEMKKNKDIDNPWALAWHMKDKGDKPHKKEAVVERVAQRVADRQIAHRIAVKFAAEAVSNESGGH
jgi:hypothetical protein